MGLRFPFVFILICFCYFSCCLSEDVTVTVGGVTTIAKTDDTFVCATLDWWPPAKCDYGMCPWGLASILSLDLDSPILLNAVKAFGNFRLRIGGSLQDQVVYNVGKGSLEDCHGFQKVSSGRFGFSRACLNMEKWDQVNEFVKKTGSVLTFGLNALYGRQGPKNQKDTLWTGDWDPSNARDLIRYSISKGYKIESWEFGNELSGSGVAAHVEADQYGHDMVSLKALLKELYSNSTMQPKIIGPGGFFDRKWYVGFLQASGPDTVDTVSHHIYSLGPGVDPHLFNKMQDPYTLDNTAQTYRDMELTVENFAPWSNSWVSESGGAYNSGGKLVSHAFVDSFWYLDQLGMSSTFNHKVWCRQTLVGGNYGMLNTTTLMPNPDYYSALLFHRLMGNGVLSTTHNGSPFLRAYSHCSRKKPGITLLLINLSNSTSLNVSVANDLNLYAPQGVGGSSVGKAVLTGKREEYHLTPKDGNLKSTTMLLNGIPLEPTCVDSPDNSPDIPALNPVVADASSPLNIAPSSIAFVSLLDFKAPACA